MYFLLYTNLLLKYEMYDRVDKNFDECLIL